MLLTMSGPELDKRNPVDQRPTRTWWWKGDR